MGGEGVEVEQITEKSIFELSPWSTAAMQAEGCVWKKAAGSVVMKISVLGSHFGGC